MILGRWLLDRACPLAAAWTIKGQTAELDRAKTGAYSPVTQEEGRSPFPCRG